MTSKTEKLIYGKFSDFIVQTGTIDGVLIYRSQWACLGGIKSFKTTSDYKVLCILKNNIVMPISRNGLKRMKEKNWIKQIIKIKLTMIYIR